MLTVNDQFHAELGKLVEEKVAALVEHLVNPGTVSDFADYRFRIGQIAGLNMVADLADEAHKLVQER